MEVVVLEILCARWSLLPSDSGQASSDSITRLHFMALGKVERFWETIWQKFLSRAQFDSFEAARERIKLWIKYYNHKRPHQGIEELCPADRFAELVKSFLRHNTSFAFITLKAKGGFIDEMIIITLYGHKIAGL